MERSLFVQNQELKQLTSEFEEADKQLQAQEKKVQELQQETARLAEEQEVLRTRGEQLRFEEQEATNQLQNIINELERFEKEKQISTFETRELQQFIEDYEKQTNELKDKQKAQEQADLAVLKEQFNHLQIQLRGARVQKAEATERQEAIEKQLATLTADFSDHEVTEESLEKQINELSAQRETLKAELAKAKEQRDRRQKEIDKLEAVLAERNREQKARLSEQSKLEVQKDRAEMILDNHLTYLQSEYQLTFEKASQDYQETTDIEDSRTKVSSLKEQIEKLGLVNLNSIEQYEQVSERHTFLATQRDDLLAAKNQLFETMDEMDDEVRTRFKEVFEAIRQEFKIVFPNMFGGGKAELVLTEPTDLLKTGIEIEVQPPGKKLQSLSLLSGGERALTAIALLFSIIRVCPVPFCILDEVEAALDEANVKRFGRYLSDFQDDTQFIVVTHRKGTMVAADVLYGVTMQESGVSKIVSVRMEDINEEAKINETKV